MELNANFMKFFPIWIVFIFVNDVIAHSSHHGLRPTPPYQPYGPYITKMHVRHPHVETGDAPDFSIVCSELNVTGVWRRSPFVGNILQVTLIDCECNKFQSNLTNFWITAPFEGCGSIIEAQQNVIVQKNSATVKVINITNNVISREHVYKYNMECVFPRNKNVSIGEHYNVTDSITRIYNKSSVGLFRTFISVYDSSSYIRTAINPVTVTSNQPIFIGIKKMTENKNLKMIVQQCFATPTADVNDETSYIFFHNKCALDSTFRILKYNEHEFNFVINTFKFIKISRVVYIHCRIYICKTNSTLPICDQNCSYRKRRDVSSSTSDENTSSSFFHSLNTRRMRNEMTAYRKRRSIDDEYFGGTSELEEVRYITSNSIFYVKKYDCSDTTCPNFSTCVDLYPAVCLCNQGYVFHFNSNMCVKDRILPVEGLHLNKTWIESYSDPSSMEFRHLAYKTEMELRRLFHELYLPEVEGVKITRATKGSVILDFDLIVAKSSSKMTTYDSLIRAILIGNKTGVESFTELDIITDKLPRIKQEGTEEKVKDLIVLLIEIAVPSLFIILIAISLLVHRQCRGNSNNVKTTTVTAMYETKQPEPLVVTFSDDTYTAGVENRGYLGGEDPARLNNILPPLIAQRGVLSLQGGKLQAGNYHVGNDPPPTQGHFHAGNLPGRGDFLDDNFNMNHPNDGSSVMWDDKSLEFMI